MKKKLLFATVTPAIAASVLLAGCFGSAPQETTVTESVTVTESTEETAASTSGQSASASVPNVENTTIDIANMFTDRDLVQTFDEAGAVTVNLNSPSNADGVSVSGDTITISKEGVYILTGTLANGTVKVEGADTDKIQLVLDNASINSNSYAGIYVKNADKVFITTKEGTTNTVSNGGTFTQTDDSNVDGAIFAKDTITLNGKGTLNVTSKSGHGIVSKDNVKITGGTLNVDSADSGIQGKDSVRIAGGDINIKAAQDAIHSENDEDATKGFVYIQDGNVTIDAYDDAIHAGPEILIAGGNIKITNCYEGYEADIVNIAGGSSDVTASDDATNAMNTLRISDGKVYLNAGGDALDSNGDIIITGGETYASGSTNNGDSVLDYDGKASISGGILVATGMSGMAQNMGSESTQGSILTATQNQSAGTTIEIKDESGNTLCSYTAPKAYDSVVISAPEIKKGGTYTVTAGTSSTDIVMNDIIYGTGMMGGMPGGMQGGRPNGQMDSPNLKDDPRTLNDESKRR